MPQSIKNKGKKIGIAGNHLTTIDLANSLTNNGYKITCIINMPSDLNGKIAGYVDLEGFARKHKIHLVRPTVYTLKDAKDREKILGYKLDVLLVFGWQRLIPDWLLKSLSIGAFGTHGCWKPLPYGRGRSVGNWGLLLGKDRLMENLFKYDAGADSGDIIDTITYDITLFDTIATLHHKDQLVHQSLILEYLPQIISGKVKYKPQSKRVKEVFFPKRTPEDGVIDWYWETNEIYNLVRAVSAPYPGAFTFCKNKKIMIWRAIPFDLFPVFINKKIGEIVASFADNTFVVRTKNSALLIQEYECKNWRPQIGLILKSVKNRSYEKLNEAGIYEKRNF